MLDYELEFGLDGEFEYEFEADLEADYESEEFLGALLSTAAPLAIRAVSSLLKESEFEDEFEGEFEDEFEYELEAEFEAVASKSDTAMMRHLGYLASQTESEAEAEAFFGAIASLASRALPYVKKALPVITKGVARVGKALWKSPRTRRLVRAIPDVLEGTAKTLTSQYSQGKPISSQAVKRALAHNTSQVLRSPRRTALAIRRSRPRRSYRPSSYRRPPMYQQRPRRAYGY